MKNDAHFKFPPSFFNSLSITNSIACSITYLLDLMIYFVLAILLLGSFSDLYGETWNVDSSGNWNVGSNWDPATVPNSSGASAAFLNAITAPRTITVDGTFSIGTLNFDSSDAYYLEGGALNLNGDIDVTDIFGDGEHSIVSDIALITNSTITQNSSEDFTISGDISGSGSLTKMGEETLIVSGRNSYSGGTILNEGIIEITSANSLGIGDIYLNAGILDSTARNITLLNDITFSGATIYSTRRLNLLGFCGGAGGLVKTGRGALDLRNLNNNFTGGITLSNYARLRFGSDAVLGDPGNTITMYDGTRIQPDATFTSSISIILSSGSSQIRVNGNNNTFTSTGVISGSGALELRPNNSTRTIVLSGINTYMGGTTFFNAGTVRVAENRNLGDPSGSLTFSNTSVVLNTTGTFTSNRTINILGGTARLDTDASTVLTLSGNIIGNGALLKQGAGTLNLNGTNSYLGGTTVTAGILEGNSSGLQGAITNNASVVFNQSTAGTYAGVMSGSGTLTKSGVGTLTLSGLNTYSGGTTLLEGVLNIGEPANLGTGDLTFNGGALHITASLSSTREIVLIGVASVNINQNISLVFSGNITGTGLLRKTGDGALTLGGINSYSGGTRVIAGTLKGHASSLQGAIVNNATVVFDQSTDGTYAGGMSGTGAVRKIGAGTLTLGGTNSYSGGTTVTGGTLKGNISNLQGAIVNNAAVVFDQPTDGIHAGAMSGTGTLTKTGAGTLTLTGTNSYSGGTTVTEGMLKGNASSLQGAITNNADTVFDQVTDGTWAGVMSGTGTFTKVGQGELKLTNTNTYTGPSNVDSGILFVAGTINSNSTLTVSEAGSIMGSGTLGALINHGTTTVGSSIGTLTVVGNFSQGASGNLEVEISPNGASDLLDITGTASLDGIVSLSPTFGTYLNGTTYTFINAAGGVTGVFSQFIENHPIIFDLIYNSNSVQFVVIGTTVFLPVPFANLKGNSRRMADYLYAGSFLPADPDLSSVISILSNSTARDFPTNLVKISPVIYSALPLVNLQNDVRMAALFTEKCKNYCNLNNALTKCQKLNTGIFIEPLYYSYNQKATQGDFANIGQIAFHADTYGTSMGSKVFLKNNFIFQVGVGYTHSSIFWKRDMGHGNWNTFYVTPFMGWSNKRGFANLLVLYSFNAYKMSRNIKVSSLNRTAKNSHNSHDLLVRGEGGGKFPLGKQFFFQLEGQFNYLSMFIEKYKETNADSLNLSVNRKTSVYFQPNMNLRLIKEFQPKLFCYIPSLYVGWLANIQVSNPLIKATFIKEPTARKNFSVIGYRGTTNQLTLGAEFVAKRCETIQMGVGFEWNLLSHYKIYQVKARFAWLF